MVWMQRPKSILSVLAMLLVTGCSTVEDIFGTAEEPPLPGERYSVLKENNAPDVADELTERSLIIGRAISNSYWSQRGGNAMNFGSHLKGPMLNDRDFEVIASAEVGDGEEWETTLTIPPVIWKDRVLVMDAAGHITAYSTQDGLKELWAYTVDDAQEDPFPGGGIAIAGETLFAVTGRGKLVALDTKDGRLRWERDVKLPVRVAPRVAMNRVFLTTVDNQLFVINALDGTISWKHQGIQEVAGVLSAPMVAVRDGLVIVPYSSGELYALDVRTGDERWRDMMVVGRPTAGRSRLTDLVASPIISAGRVYLGTQSGLLSVMDMRNGARVWEEEVPGVQHMWLASGYLYVTTTDRRLLSVYAEDGRVRWITELPGYDDVDSDERWVGSMLLSAQLFVFGAHGEMLKINPEDGAILNQHDWQDDVFHVPSVANEELFAVSRGATLYRLK